MFVLAGIFDEAERTIYTDFTGVHIVPDGNDVIAGRMSELLASAGYLDGLVPALRIQDEGGGER